MTMMVSFRVEGKPVGKGRPRFARRGNFVSTYTPKGTADYEKKIREASIIAMQGQQPLETAVSVSLYIDVEVPKSYPKDRTANCLEGREHPCKKPDADNIAKCFLDAMNEIVYKDDSQVLNLKVMKRYAPQSVVSVYVSEIAW